MQPAYRDDDAVNIRQGVRHLAARDEIVSVADVIGAPLHHRRERTKVVGNPMMGLTRQVDRR
jgi:hypothetical protein